MANNKKFKEIIPQGLPNPVKVGLAILGGTNVIFSIFLPIAVGLMLSTYYPLNGVSRAILIIAGILSSIYRAVDVGGIDTLEYFFDKFKRKDN